MSEPAIEPVERRCAARVETCFPVMLARAGGADVPVTAANISVTGMLARSSTELAVWSRLTAALPGAGLREVRVVRRDGDGYGCLFQTPLEPEEFDAVLESDEAVAGFERLRALAEMPPPPPKRGVLGLFRRT